MDELISLSAGPSQHSDPHLNFLPLIFIHSWTDPVVKFIQASALLDYSEHFAAQFPTVAILLRALYHDANQRPGEIYRSLAVYETWLNAAPDGFICAVGLAAEEEAPVLFVCRPAASVEEISKIDFLVRLNEQKQAPHLFGAVFSAARHLYRHDQALAARAVIRNQVERETHFLLEQATAIVDYTLAGNPVPLHLQDLFGESDYLKGRFCHFPFTTLFIEPDGRAFSCCSVYLNLSVGSIRANDVKEVLNSEMAQDIRRSILDGSFLYCNRLNCAFIAGDNLPTRAEAREDAQLRGYIDSDATELESLRQVSLALDLTCNLSCPCCRKELIIEKGDEVTWRVEFVKTSLLPLLKNVARLSLDGAGEFAMSEACRAILEGVNPVEFPNLKLDFITNGLLLNEGFWQRYKNIEGMVRTVRVSIDAATGQTYAKLRRGGDFTKLQHNMKLLSDMRAAGLIDELSMFFIYQADNIREMKRFVEWACELGVDWVLFEALHDRGSYPEGIYQTLAVHQPSHPRYREFLEIVADPIFANPIVSRSWEGDPSANATERLNGGKRTISMP